MKTKEIPRNEWQGFFDMFSRQHEGWLATLEILGSEIGAQVEERGLTLEGIVSEGDEVVVRWTATGRRRSPLVSASRRRTQAAIARTDDGTWLGGTRPPRRTTACRPGSRTPYHVRRRPTETSTFTVGSSR